MAMTCPYGLAVPGGVQEQVRAIASQMALRGHSVTVLSPGGDDGALDGSGVESRSVGRCITVPANGSRALVSLSLGAASAAARQLRRERIDLVHLHEPLAPVLGWPMMGSRAFPTVATYHRSGADLLYRLAGAALGRRARRVDRSFAVSAAAARTAREMVGVESDLAFNGIDIEQHQQVEPWPTAGATVLFVGRDEPRKGRQVLLEAARHLSEDVTVWSTGDPPRGWRQADGAQVEFLGRIGDEEKRRRVKAADLLCAPSLGGESFGIVLLEAMAAGTPVVCSDIDGYRQVVDGAGSLVPPGDPGALARAIGAHLATGGDPAPSALARARDFSMAALCDLYEAAYEEVLRT